MKPKCPKCKSEEMVKVLKPTHFQCWNCTQTIITDGKRRSVPYNFRLQEEDKGEEVVES